MKTTIKHHFTPTRRARVPKIENYKCWWGCTEIIVLIHWLVGMQHIRWCSHFGRQSDSSSNNWTLSYYLTRQFHSQTSTQEKWKHKDTQKLHANPHSSILHNSQKVETVQIFTHWCVWYGHTMEYYKANQNEPMHATKWINSENIMLSERWPQKITNCIIPFTWNKQNR